jgi:hypothetical protein
MAQHRDRHPEFVEGCNTCRWASVGYDGKHYTKVTAVTNEEIGGTAGYTKEHRSGRQDALVTPAPVNVKLLNGK